MVASDDNPARLVDHDPAWAPRAEQLLGKVRQAFYGLPGAAEAEFEHIGSTSVPQMAAKPFLDLQVRVSPLSADA